MGKSWGNHRGIIGEIGELSHQHPQQAILGDGLRSTIMAFQLAVQNLLREADVKARVGSSIHIARLTMRHHLFLEF